MFCLRGAPVGGKRMIQISEAEIGEEERAAVDGVLRSGWLAQGCEVAAFEQELARELSGTQHAVAVSSGSAALELVLVALGVGRGDEVVTTPFTFAATVNAIIRTGASVRFADIGDDYNLDPAAVEAAVTQRTRLILPVHLYGLPADLDGLSALGIPIVEDAAQAHLASYCGRLVGGLGVAGCFSFYASKNMTVGEGGAITTNDPDLSDRLRILRNQGMRSRYEYVSIGYNYRLTDVAAAIGRVQLRKLPKLTAARRKIASLLLDALEGIDEIALPTIPTDRIHSWHQFTVMLSATLDRDAVLAELERQGVRARIYYPQVVPDAGPYRDHPLVDASLPLDRARSAAKSVLSLPVHPQVMVEDVTRIADSLRRAVHLAHGARP